MSVHPALNLPTMYDLPSEDPAEPGLPDEFHYYQPTLLRETFQPTTYPSDEVFVAADLNLYYDPQHTGWHKRPDWFAVLGGSRLYHGQELRLSYVMWDEQVAPYLVIELLSEGTEGEDLGRTTRKGKQPPTKWEVYEQRLRIPYYVVYGRQRREADYFRLGQKGYERVEPGPEPLWLAEAGIGLGLWEGEYDGLRRQWLRFCDSQGQWLLTPAEQQAQRAEQQAQRAERAEQEKEQQAQRAAEAEAELARLRALLKQQR